MVEAQLRVSTIEIGRLTVAVGLSVQADRWDGCDIDGDSISVAKWGAGTMPYVFASQATHRSPS